MRKVLFTAFILGFSAICNAQQRKADTTTAKFTPPVIVKDEGNAKNQSAEAVKFTPPVIVKDKAPKSKKTKRKEAKFTPPVIVKDHKKKD